MRCRPPSLWKTAPQRQNFALSRSLVLGLVGVETRLDEAPRVSLHLASMGGRSYTFIYCTCIYTYTCFYLFVPSPLSLSLSLSLALGGLYERLNFQLVSVALALSISFFSHFERSTTSEGG